MGQSLPVFGSFESVFKPAGWIIVGLALYFAFVPPAPQWFFFGIAAFGVLMAVFSK